MRLERPEHRLVRRGSRAKGEEANISFAKEYRTLDTRVYPRRQGCSSSRRDKATVSCSSCYVEEPIPHSLAESPKGFNGNGENLRAIDRILFILG